MKKIFLLMFNAGILLVLFQLFPQTEQASRAAQSLLIGREHEITQDETPWIDPPDYNYRRPIIVHSSYTSNPSWYQVLIHLDSSNFDFEHAKTDGSDIQITSSDGTSPLNFWKESWNSGTQSAYLWVRLTPLPSGDTPIYIYYGNPAGISLSSGSSTFDSFDDNWGNITGLSVNQEEIKTPQDVNSIEGLLSWEKINGTPTNPVGILTLENGEGIRSTSTYPFSSPSLRQAVGFKANYGSGNGNVVGGFFDCSSGQDCTTRQRTLIGDRPSPSNPSDMFLINYLTSLATTKITDGTTNWHGSYHVYEIRWSSDFSEGVVDHKVSTGHMTSQVPTSSLPIVFYSMAGSNAALQVDWVYVRQYRDPEPTATVGAEQGYVDLGINLVDTPDPISAALNKDLDYLLTVSNNSLADAAGVVVTDTLPSSVTFISAEAPSGCNHIGSIVKCNLGTITANSSANATIRVKPTVDENIKNEAIVGSPGYETNLKDNYDVTMTLVDSEPPNVQWQDPFYNRQLYYFNNGLILLKANAEDNDSVNRVEFWRYSTNNEPIKINSVNTPPYQLEFNSDDLIPNHPWPFEVFAFDRAGNRSATEPPELRQIIWIERIFNYFTYLPVAINK